MDWTPSPFAALRPATISDILDRTFRIYRNNFSEMLKLMLAVIVPLAAIGLLISIQSTNALIAPGSAASTQTRVISSIGSTYLFQTLSAFLQVIIVHGTLIYMTSEALLGQPVRAWNAVRTASARFWSMAQGLFIVGVLLIFLFAGTGMLVGLCNVLALGLGVVVYIALTSTMLLMPTLMLERVGPMRAINRGASLSRGRFWTILGVLFLITVITSLVNVALVFAITFATRTAAGALSYGALLAIQGAFQIIITIVITPILPIASTLLYYDARIRLEGLDIALQSLGQADARPADIEGPQPNLALNSRDTINLGILTVVGLVIGVGGWAAIQALVRARF